MDFFQVQDFVSGIYIVASIGRERCLSHIDTNCLEYHELLIPSLLFHFIFDTLFA